MTQSANPPVQVEARPATTMQAPVACAACPCCGGTELEIFFELPHVPADCIRLWPSREDALHCPMGSIRLAFCKRCGLISNATFDPTLMCYDEAYDNSLQFSRVFQEYTRDLAEYLIYKYDLHGKNIVEIGCGKGDFLALLCSAGNNYGVGFDPTYVEGRLDTSVGKGITIIKDYYSDVYAGTPADFVCCRQVLEHIWNPASLLASIRALGKSSEIALFLELPNVSFMLRQMNVWDVIYQHCIYYSASPATRMLIHSGFDVLTVRETFAGQYLAFEARAAAMPEGVMLNDSQDIATLEFLAKDVANFAEHNRQRVLQWRRRLDDMASQHKRVVVWGAGAKGVSFLNSFPGEENLEYVVDINPYKQGKFVPVTGQKVVSPDFLREYKPDVIVTANPIYMEEIARLIESLGLSPELISL